MRNKPILINTTQIKTLYKALAFSLTIILNFSNNYFFNSEYDLCKNLSKSDPLNLLSLIPS